MLDGSKKLQCSRKISEKISEVITSGANSPGRLFRDVETPIIIADKAKGSIIQDVDGNEYIDYMMGLGPNILGHSPDIVSSTLESQIKNGAVFGINCKYEYELASRLVNAVSHVDEIRFTCSGTEAVMTAIRVARAYTNRPYILKFRGGYHGHSDGLLTHATKSAVRNNPLSMRDGIADVVRNATLMSRYNDETMVCEIFKENGANIAAVIVEPVATNMGLILPDVSFLGALRKCCDEAGAVLIFDEVVSGFRCSYGAVSDELGVIPDLTTFGKVIGGGLPVGAYGGRRELMKQVGTNGGVFQGGSFAGNPLTMVAGVAALDELSSGHLLDNTKLLVEYFCQRTREKFEAYGIPFGIQSYGTMATYIFNSDMKSLRNFDDVELQNSDLFAKFHRRMAERGVLFAPTIEEPIFFSTVHTKEQIDLTVDLSVEILSSII
ncbi:aspartate aminotransferase family protein [Marinomonas transparens]|uniref:Glutamate-1-semialdehyde 2,1-aminomutase n=1 Tax=Marinomonas transparens TaxID=2795388 RepID=A0A934JIL8_9GAMM|nr:glutamate-1-semialdehyde 2,1-aminomutase [Marinomonas transparens]MBJ7536730.1 glutamate-1-semialdehyde 2,1-aminomutase [Marinomonas transparens]